MFPETGNSNVYILLSVVLHVHISVWFCETSRGSYCALFQPAFPVNQTLTSRVSRHLSACTAALVFPWISVL